MFSVLLVGLPVTLSLSDGLFYPLSPHDTLKHHFKSLKNKLKFPITRGFRMNISMTLAYQ